MAISDYSTTAASNTTIASIDVSGTTGKVKDGDNVMRAMAADMKAGLITGYTTTATAAGTTTLTVASNSYQYFTGTTTQTVVMPVTSTLELGRTWVIVNNSTGALTVNSSGANLIVTVASGQRAAVQCILLTGTDAASWAYSTPNLLTSTDAGATAGPVLEFYRNSATPAASDILGNITFNGEDSAGNTQEYASIETVIVDATSTSEDGRLDFYVTKAGTRTKFASMTATAMAFTAAAAYSFDAPLSVSTTAANDGLTVTSTDAGGSSGPRLTLDRNSASPTAGDNLGQIVFNGRDAGANSTTFTAISNRLDDTTDGSEDATLFLQAMKAGTLTNYLYVGANAAATATANALGLPLGQLSFPATQNASTDANTLDDYEEGTYSLTMSFATAGSSSWATTSSVGGYQKVGNRVHHASRATSTPTIGTGSGNLQVGNMPFVSIGASIVKFTAHLATSNITYSAGRTQITGVLGNSTQLATFELCGSAVTTAAVTAALMTDGAACTIDLSGTYETTA